MDGTTSETRPAPATSQLSARIASALEFIVKAVAIGVPIAYAVGRIYAEGYWSELGIPSSLMRYSAEDYIYFGFISVINNLASWLGFNIYSSLGYALLFALCTAALLVGALVTLKVIDALTREWRVKAKQEYDAIKASKKFGKVAFHVEGFAAVTSAISTISAGAIATAFLMFVFVAASSKAGQEAAKRSVSELLDSPKAVADYRTESGLSKAPISECNEHWCAIVEDGRLVAIRSDAVVRVDQGGTSTNTP